MASLDVAIICANYNNGEYLRDLVESVNQQKDSPSEIIICDDASTDNSVSIIEGLQKLHPNLILVRHNKNAGVANARNKALEYASATYIAILDSDDLICQNRLKKQADFLQENSVYGVLGSNCTYFRNSDKKELGVSNFPSSHEDIFNYFKAGQNGVLNGSAMIRAELLKNEKYDQETVWAEDYDLFSRLITKEVKMFNLDETLTKVRVHGDSATTNLKLETIEKIHLLRQKYFKIPFRKNEVLKEYNHLSNYRKYLIEKNSIKKYLYLLKAIYFKPQKLFKRLLNY